MELNKTKEKPYISAGSFIKTAGAFFINRKAFTLLEVIITVIIIGVLAVLAFTQYSYLVEKARTAEAIQAISALRPLAIKYYLDHNNSVTGLTNAGLGVDNTCTAGSFYKYSVDAINTTTVYLNATRCTSDGKAPNASREYQYYLITILSSDQNTWCCHYTDTGDACFGQIP